MVSYFNQSGVMIKQPRSVWRRVAACMHGPPNPEGELLHPRQRPSPRRLIRRGGAYAANPMLLERAGQRDQRRLLW
jgi:hypothetical protein